jgi:hypothetical protein
MGFMLGFQCVDSSLFVLCRLDLTEVGGGVVGGEAEEAVFVGMAELPAVSDEEAPELGGGFVGDLGYVLRRMNQQYRLQHIAVESLVEGCDRVSHPAKQANG